MWGWRSGGEAGGAQPCRGDPELGVLSLATKAQDSKPRAHLEVGLAHLTCRWSPGQVRGWGGSGMFKASSLYERKP